MKCLVNATNLKSGGALQVARSLVQIWQRNSDGHEFHVICGPALHNLDNLSAPIYLYQYHEHPQYRSKSRSRFQRYMQQMEEHLQPDVAFTVFGPSLWRPKCVHLCGFANGIYLFDKDPYIQAAYPKLSIRNIKYRLYRHMLLRKLVQNADAFWVETEVARQELKQIPSFKSKNIFVVGNTYPEELMPEETKTISGIPQLLFLSAYYPHKNFQLLPELINRLSERATQVCFVLSLPEERFRVLSADVADKSYLRNNGPVSTDMLAASYRACDFVFIPSLLETFSASFPEAMRCGKPIICSDRPFARTLCQDAALYFDPLSADDASEKITQLISNPELQQKLRTAGKARLEQLETPQSRGEKILNLLIQLSIESKK